MNQDILDFFLDLAKDSKLCEEIRNKTLDECYEIAIKRSNGKFTKEELADFVEKFYNQQNKMRNQDVKKEDNVDDEHLKHVAGGRLFGTLKNLSDTALDDLETILLDVRSPEDTVNLLGATTDLFSGAANFGIALATLASKMKDDSKLSELESLQEQRERLQALLALQSGS